jgi:GAF domain-containing protein
MISSSPTNVQPVFDAVAESAARLCESFDSHIWRRDGDRLFLAAHHGPIPVMPADEFTLPLVRGTVSGRSVLEGRTVQVADVQTEAAEFPESRELSRRIGFRTILSVPLMREAVALGTIILRRTEAQPFTEQQVALLQTFADQAVIAIENVRLFNELEERNQALTEALEQQTATSEILSVISRSPTEVGPVLAAVAESAARLCAAVDAIILSTEGPMMRRVAHFGDIASVSDVRSVTRDTPSGRAIVERQIMHIEDILEEFARGEYLEARALQEGSGFRTVLVVPLIREGVVIGVINIRRLEVRAFTAKQIALVKTFADQAVIAINNVRLFKELEARNRDLREALDRQTATAEILRVISRSQTDVQPVFDTIADNAVSLFRPWSVAVYRFDGECVHVAAVRGGLPGSEEYLREQGPRRPTRDFMAGRCIIECSVVHIPDFETERDVPAAAREIALLRGFRATLTVPMLKDGQPIGVISVSRAEAGAFSQAEIDLLQTFADQAVIAIENVRLFKELEARNGDLTTALDRQTATADVLRIIAQSPTELQPVLDVIAASALRLCAASDAVIERLEGDRFYNAAHAGAQMKGLVGLALPLTRRFPGGRAILDREPVILDDIQLVAEREYPDTLELLKLNTIHSVAEIPLLSEGKPLGTIAVLRAEVRPFSDAEISLLKTFADQAVIAIENVRLFTELGKRNRELTEALEQQTATSEILRTIARAQTDVQPVFDTIVRSAAQLCHATTTAVFLTEGGMVYHPASYGSAPEALAAIQARFPRPLDRETAAGTAILTRSVIHVPDVQESSAVEFARETGRVVGFRSLLSVPMLRQGEAVGAINVTRREAGPFSDADVALLKTFADQAVIAIENVRLFKELETRTAALTRSVDQLTALGEVGRAVSSTLDLETVLTTIVSRAVELSGLDGGIVSEYEEASDEFVQRAASQAVSALATTLRGIRYRRGEGAIGRTAITRQPVQVPDITVPGAYDSRARANLIESGVRAVLAVPMIHQDRLIGCLGVTRNRPGNFPSETIQMLQTFATQSALAIQNARLFREIEEKSGQLEVASQHKSEFLANMSHELRTPLNAIIGFSEVLTDRMFGELNEKQEEYLKDIYASGTHLLSLINDILDLSKIEAGRMELELTDFDLPQAIDNAVMLVRERAGRRSIALQMNVDERLSQVRADERKIRQVVLNLLSNAIKFTPEGGRIEVTAVPKDGFVEVSVSDTGVGISPEDQEAVFEEFRQVGTAEKNAEGTGLGLTLCRKFIELHGGRIWVKSRVGVGSTFTFTIPVRRGE